MKFYEFRFTYTFSDISSILFATVKGVVPSIFPRRMCILHNQGNTLVFTGSETVKNWPSFRQPITPFFCVFETQLDDRSELR